jgi:type 1 fimbria pilin
MKTLLLSFLLASTAVLAPAADKASVTGPWQIHISISGTERDQSCTFTQTNNDLTGSCNSDQGTVNISGKVDEKKINWTYKSEYEGSPITVKYQGTLDSENKIAGNVNVEEFGAEGDFTATRSK